MRAHAYLALGAATVIALSACAYIGQATGPPTSEPSPSSAATDTPTPTRIATLQPVSTADAGPSATPTATVSEPATPSPESPTGVWQRLDDFPPPGASVISITTYAGGFVAVGNVPSDRRCEDLNDGRIWTSADGHGWAEADVDLADVTVTKAVNAGGTIYAFGSEGSWDCPSDRSLVVSSNDGIGWRIADMNVGQNEYFYDYTSVGATLLALGEAYDSDGRFLGSVWTSTNGVEWDLAPDSPESAFELEGAVASGDTVVAFDYGAEPAWVSTDGGSNWITAAYKPLYDVYLPKAAAGSERFVAVGAACCTTPNQEFGYAIASTDGVTWHESDPFGFRQVPQGVVALPDSFVTIGRQSWSSHDGLSWVLGPELPGYESDGSVPPTGAATADTVVIINDRQAWAADMVVLNSASNGQPPRRPEMPEIGVRYPATLWTHCGWPDTHFAMRAWVPDPPIDDVNPPRGLDEEDHGWFTQLSENELQYESSRGRVITLRPSEAPVWSGPCA